MLPDHKLPEHRLKRTYESLTSHLRRSYDVKLIRACHDRKQGIGVFA